MKRIIYIYILIFGLFYSCVENRELSFNGLYTEPGYFVECYLIPGEVYRLSATKLQPLYEDYTLDYSLEFNVKIDTLTLKHGLFKQPSANYLYNYGHTYCFIPKKQDLAQLFVRTPDNDIITATTTIPEQVDLFNALFHDNEIKLDFMLSADSWHNYYMININAQHTDTLVRKNRFLDYSDRDTKDTVSFKFNVTPKGDLEKLTVVLRRMTRANYEYQISMQNAKDANRDNLVLPSPLAGNLKNATGIFTCFTCDSVVWKWKQKTTIQSPALR